MFSFQALASGSSGNSYLLRTDTACLLFDVGIRLPLLTRFLSSEGVSLRDITAVLLSHEHRDHCSSAGELSEQYGTPIYAVPLALSAAGLSSLAGARAISVSRPVSFGDVEVSCFPVEHDAVQPVGFLVRVGEFTMTIATDLGRPTNDVLTAIALADLVVLEANHDADMLRVGRYPAHLRRRVSGPRGHLSNTQAAAVLTAGLKSPETEVWLAHLSKENNTPKLALETVRRAMASTRTRPKVQVAGRDRPSLRWTGQSRPRQLSLLSGTG